MPLAFSVKNPLGPPVFAFVRHVSLIVPPVSLGDPIVPEWPSLHVKNLVPGGPICSGL
jgi:hypothetical protein